jgi:hypothetical protein
MKVAANLLDRLTLRVLAPDPNHCLHNQHPELDHLLKTRPVD